MVQFDVETSWKKKESRLQESICPTLWGFTFEEGTAYSGNPDSTKSVTLPISTLEDFLVNISQY